MDVSELMDRVLGFFPQRSIFWGAVGTVVGGIMIQYVINLFKSITILPWMREDNQEKRQKLLAQTKKQLTQK